MLDKTRTIEHIQQINGTARAEWLQAFDLSTLRQYLANLQRTLEPRGGHSMWIRAGDTPAVVTRKAMF